MGKGEIRMSHIGGLAMVEIGRVSVSEEMRWHVLSVARSAIAQRSLDRERIETWAPLCEVVRRHRPRGAKHDVLEPWRGHLFPGYLLARFRSKYWLEVQDLDGIDAVLLIDGNPAALRDAWVDGLAAEIDLHGGALKITADGKRLDPRPPKRRGPLYAKGQVLRVLAGNFQGYNGLYLGDSKDRVTVLLNMLGRAVETTLPATTLEPV
jgi:transcription antitermination factor NusG